MNSDYTDERLVELGRQALTVEIDALRAQLPRLGTDFARACRICLDCRGRIVVTGMGKSGHIGGKKPPPPPRPRPPPLFLPSRPPTPGHLRRVPTPAPPRPPSTPPPPPRTPPPPPPTHPA